MILPTQGFWKSHKLIWLESTGSTNDDLKAIWRDKDFCHTLEVADTQSKGKGQYERKWASKSVGQCLMFSFTADVAEYEFPISMIAGAALAVALERLGLNKNDFWLKWPNDIWVNKQKLSGILTESTCTLEGFRCVIGIGLNILPLGEPLVNATSLAEQGIKVSREEVLEQFIIAWDEVFNMTASQQAKIWNSFGGQFWQQQVRVQVPSEPEFIATPKAILPDGSLVVATQQGDRTINSATLFPIV